MRTPLGVAPALAAAAAFCGAPLPAQQPPVAPRPISEAVRVNIVNVEVFVAGPDGRPLLGLQPADFELDEDGAPVAITNFFAAQREPDAPGGAVSQPPSSAPSPLPERVGQTAVDREQRLNLVVFVDNGNISQVGRTIVFEQLRKLLREGLRPGDRVGLVSSDRSLRETLAFTDRPESALAALDAMARETAEGTFIAAERNYLQRSIARLEGSESVASGRFFFSGRDSNLLLAQGLLDEITSYSERNYQLYRGIMDGLIRFVDSLAGLPGRKALLYVSEGLPARVGEELYGEWQAKFPALAAAMKFDPAMAAARFNITSYFKDVVRHANAGRVTIYTIDAARDRGLEGISSETLTMTSMPLLAAAEAMNREVSMIAFSAGTGGRFLPNTPGLGETLVRTAADFSSYYSLGYSPEHLGDGKYHRLAVRVNRPGCTVRHREGYLDKPEPARFADRTGAALLAGDEDNPLDARVALGEGRKEKGSVYLVPLSVTIPGGRLALPLLGSGAGGRVSICMALKDEESRRADTQCKSFDISVPAEKAEAFARQAAVFTFDVHVRKGRNRLAVSARDEVAQLESTIVREFVVPAGKS